MYRLESTSTELEQLTETAINTSDLGGENVLGNGIVDTPTIRKAVSHPRLGMAVSSTPRIVDDRVKQLKIEFGRCVAERKTMRHEIAALKNDIAEKSQQIEQLKADENQALIELTMSKENSERLTVRLKNVEKELEQCKKSCNPDHSKKEDNEMLNRLHQLEQENANFRLNCDHLNETIRSLEDERDRIEAKYREACTDIAELQQKLSKSLEPIACLECEKEKFITKEAQQECTRLKDLYGKINNEKEEVMRKLRQMENHDTKKELLEKQNTIASLERSLQLAEMKYTEIQKILDREKCDHETQMQDLRTKYEEGEEIFVLQIVTLLDYF